MRMRWLTLWFYLILCCLQQNVYAVDQVLSEPNEVKQYQFVAVSDIHFDPFLACHKKSPCPLIDKLNVASVSDWDQLLNKYDDSVMRYAQDTNTALLNAFVDKAKEVSKHHEIKFVMFLGDMLGHHYRRQYRNYVSNKNARNYAAFVKKSMQYLSIKLSQAFPQTLIYFAVGNNDSNTGDYSVMANGQFFNEMGSLWPSVGSRFKYAGYYTVQSSSLASLQLIVLNTVLFSKQARGRNVTSAATQQLKWLQDELAQAKSKKQHVFLLMHIPEAIDIYLTSRQRLFRLYSLWKPAYIEAYEAIIGKYQDTIAGTYSGHLHTQWSGVVYAQNKKISNLIAHGVPSISPFFGQNPAFQVFSCTLVDQQCESESTYQYILSGNPHWLID